MDIGSVALCRFHKDHFDAFPFLSTAAVLSGSYGGLSGLKFVLRYSIRASRSAASTTAPHFIILSTSLVHAALVRRCCRMMRASWHSVQAVVALACIAPGGRSAVGFDGAGFWARARNGDETARKSKATTRGREECALLVKEARTGAPALVDFVKICGAAESRALSNLRDSLLGDMDVHLIDGVVEIAAGIPDGRCGLGAALAVCGTRHNCVLAGPRRFPIVDP